MLEVRWFGKLFLILADKPNWPRVLLGRVFGREGSTGVNALFIEGDEEGVEMTVKFEDGSIGAVLFYSDDEEVAQLLSKLQP
jgi:L-asparaginase II